jgi:hypothetical protein
VTASAEDGGAFLAIVAVDGDGHDLSMEIVCLG